MSRTQYNSAWEMMIENDHHFLFCKRFENRITKAKIERFMNISIRTAKNDCFFALCMGGQKMRRKSELFKKLWTFCFFLQKIAVFPQWVWRDYFWMRPARENAGADTPFPLIKETRPLPLWDAEVIRTHIEEREVSVWNHTIIQTSCPLRSA